MILVICRLITILYAIFCMLYYILYAIYFLDPEGGTQKATLVVLVLVLVVISSLASKNPGMAFLYAAERNETWHK